MYISKGNLRMKVPTFSIPAKVSCPGSTPHCRKYCYALKAETMYANVRRSRDSNLKETLKCSFESDMNYWMSKHNPKYYRIHESGDFHTQEYFNKWCRIASDNPGTKFLAYTQVYDLDVSEKPDNLILYYSVWDDSAKVPNEGLKAYVVDDGRGKINEYDVPGNPHVCQKGHKIKLCNECMHCYEGRGDVVFILH